MNEKASIIQYNRPFRAVKCLKVNGKEEISNLKDSFCHLNVQDTKEREHFVLKGFKT